MSKFRQRIVNDAMREIEQAVRLRLANTAALKLPDSTDNERARYLAAIAEADETIERNELAVMHQVKILEAYLTDTTAQIEVLEDYDLDLQQEKDYNETLIEQIKNNLNHAKSKLN